MKDGFTETPIGMTSSGSLFYARSAGGMPHQYLIHRNPAQGESAVTFMGQAARGLRTADRWRSSSRVRQGPRN